MALFCLPVRQRLVRLGYRRVHDLARLPGAGGQLDDVAIGIAEIDRTNKAVVDRPAHLSTLGLSLVQHGVNGLGLDAERNVDFLERDRKFESGFLQQRAERWSSPLLWSSARHW